LPLIRQKLSICDHGSSSNADSNIVAWRKPTVVRARIEILVRDEIFTMEISVHADT
jgi:hypothetical protein